MTQRLDPGAGWYGEFLRRDPDGMRACLEGAAIPPWDVVESLLRDLEGARGAEFAARETVYAAQLRAAAVTAWDRLPGGEEELRTLLAASAAQRTEAQTALRNLTARLGGAAGPAETDALTRERSWTQDDVARAAARHEDLAARLASLRTTPLPGVPRQRTTPPEHSRQPGAWTHTGPERAHHPAGWGEAPAEVPAEASADRSETPPGPSRRSSEESEAPPGQFPHQGGWPEDARPSGGDEAPGGWTAAPPARGGQSAEAAGAPPEQPRHMAGWPEEPDGRTGASPGGAPERAEEAPASGGQGPVGRAEGRWLRGGRRSGGARYAGSAAPDAPAFTPPPGQPADTGLPGSEGLGAEHGRPAPRGARFGPPQDPLPRGVRFGRPRPEPVTPREAAPAAVGEAAPHPSAPAGPSRAVAAELLALRAQGRSGEAHVLLCEAAAGPAERLPGLAVELARAGLAADWATLLWEAGSLPPGQLAAAAAALGDAGREADCDALLRQGVARPAAEVADAALALGDAGRVREADALLCAFVRVRTAEEAAGLARRDPQWFVPRLLQAARALPGSRQRDLVHALRVAGIAAG
ncbi:hypothetical protein ACIQNK_11205 [Streptomyces sp. NPDC091273]|uniref:hypothetical protein n=1 Tax=Streptomyces sp. NPDC091273 TaxID=3365982 RepID=UPI0038165078